MPITSTKRFHHSPKAADNAPVYPLLPGLLKPPSTNMLLAFDMARTCIRVPPDFSDFAVPFRLPIYKPYESLLSLLSLEWHVARRIPSSTISSYTAERYPCG